MPACLGRSGQVVSAWLGHASTSIIANPYNAVAKLQVHEARERDGALRREANTKNPDRGPLLIIEGEKDHTVPWAVHLAVRARSAAPRPETA
jgi:hypothetical protein